MQEIEKRIALLRLLLADVEGKRAQLSEMERQYEAQLARIVEFVVYREGDLGNALSLMAEVQSKRDEVVRTSNHLSMIASKANLELEMLVLTKRVAEARSQLVELEERQKELSARLSRISGDEAGAGAEIEAGEIAARGLEASQVEDIRSIYEEVEAVAREISRLNNLITEASERAARTIQPTP
jgi:chromosome segregation ATPase